MPLSSIFDDIGAKILVVFYHYTDRVRTGFESLEKPWICFDQIQGLEFYKVVLKCLEFNYGQ